MEQIPQPTLVPGKRGGKTWFAFVPDEIMVDGDQGSPCFPGLVGCFAARRQASDGQVLQLLCLCEHRGAVRQDWSRGAQPPHA